MRGRDVCAVAVALVAKWLLWDNPPIDPVAYELPALPALPADAHPLGEAEVWLDGRVPGAEHIEFHCAEQQRCHAFAGLADGSVVRFDPDAGPAGEVEFLNGTWALRPKRAPDFLRKCGDVNFGERCGRPLGLKVSPDGEHLLIADAYLGLLSMDLATTDDEGDSSCSRREPRSTMGARCN